MNDPWDVKSVRQAGQYMSCMKINGVPLLPPVLSIECRKEMQYYKLLAKEVEKRISILKPYVDIDSDGSEDRTDAPELPECEDELFIEETKYNDKHKDKLSEPPSLKTCNITNVNIISTPSPIRSTSPAFMIDLNLNINETRRSVLDIKKPPIEVPERDYNSPPKILEMDVITNGISEVKANSKTDEVINFILGDQVVIDPLPDIPLNQDGPSSLSSKSFTGSLNNIHTESLKESQSGGKLLRQRSYTILNPSPQLLAHLEVQALNTGIEMHSISMSESMSNLSSPCKKRRSWDLESAKVKWSSMALELNQKNVAAPKPSNRQLTKSATKNPYSPPPSTKGKPVHEKPRSSSLSSKMNKSEPVQKAKRSLSPIRNANLCPPRPNTTNGKDTASPKVIPQKKETIALKLKTPEIVDPASHVRQLYEKIQKQQSVQMASLVDKQKKEQLLLQQVFEEQNNLLYKQLKTICPTSPIEAKAAWADKIGEADRGPVSLSQLISSNQSPYESPVSTLTETKNFLNQCNDVLKKSRDITGSIKKNSEIRSQSSKIEQPKIRHEGSRTRTHSPVKGASRKLNYDSSTERDYDILLTDRTNDTLEGLNLTLPLDLSEGNRSPNLNGADVAMVHRNPAMSMYPQLCVHSAESSIRSMEHVIHNSMINSRRQSKSFPPPTARGQAAATKIVAYAKGYLVRRLMKTERVQGTVQTIRDALLCALQLHQDREGIRGADVDLHRRLIQQITAACYALHDTFVASTPAERCAMIAADRGRRRSIASKQPTPRQHRQSDI